MTGDWRDEGPGDGLRFGRGGSDRRADRHFFEPAVMGPPIAWLASDEAAGVHDERIIAAEFEHWLRDRKAAGEAG